MTGQKKGEKQADNLQITIKDTFSLTEVPKEALYVGLAGVVPYLATSLSTVYLSDEIHYSATHGHGYLIDGAVAEQLLHIIEPIQLGYGAVVCILPFVQTSR